MKSRMKCDIKENRDLNNIQETDEKVIEVQGENINQSDVGPGNINKEKSTQVRNEVDQYRTERDHETKDFDEYTDTIRNNPNPNPRPSHSSWRRHYLMGHIFMSLAVLSALDQLRVGESI